MRHRPVGQHSHGRLSRRCRSPARCPSRARIAGRYCAPGPAQPPPSTTRSPSSWMTSSSSAAALPVSPAPCSSAVPAARSPFSIPACRATASPRPRGARPTLTVLEPAPPPTPSPRHSHGLLGHDHKPPLDILAKARQQLARYPTIKLVSARAESVSGAIDDFNVLTSDGESFGARRLILSYGVAAQMPDVPGFAEGWGTSIVPCPYCDGFEVAGQHWGLVWSGPQSHNQVRLFHDWTDRLTLFADGHDIP